jgi:hypothetical protein
MIPAQDKIILIDPAEILYVFAQEDLTYLQTLEERLPPSLPWSWKAFITRYSLALPYLVNLQQIKGDPYTA